MDKQVDDEKDVQQAYQHQHPSWEIPTWSHGYQGSGKAFDPLLKGTLGFHGGIPRGAGGRQNGEVCVGWKFNGEILVSRDGGDGQRLGVVHFVG